MNTTVVIIGAGPMAVEYLKVLVHLGVTTEVKGRGPESARNFESKTGKTVRRNWGEVPVTFTESLAIVAVDEGGLWEATEEALHLGFQRILVEKPAALSIDNLRALSRLNDDIITRVKVGYNRRFYEVVDIMIKQIELDGGMTSGSFDFSERSTSIEPLIKGSGVKENWFFHNSTHVVDTFEYICGGLAIESSRVQGALTWHSKGSQFAGFGRTLRDSALFSYSSDWEAPAGWEIIVRTQHHKLHLKPLEKLTIADHFGHVEVFEEVNFSLNLKPGLLRMVEAFIHNDMSGKLKTLSRQIESADVYSAILFGLKS